MDDFAGDEKPDTGALGGLGGKEKREDLGPDRLAHADAVVLDGKDHLALVDRDPDAKGKMLYVWFDAPIGYIGSTLQWCEQTGEDFDSWWRHADSGTEIHHFIGKDIVYFHTLFWPAVLDGSGMRTPTSVFAHGFLTVDGAKMSKSRGTFIKPRTYLDHLHPDYLRYYYAAKLGPTIEDIDLNLDDFIARVNSDLVGKLVNIASRCAGFINKRFDGTLADDINRSVIQEQVEMGVAVRMAVLQALARQLPNQ